MLRPRPIRPSPIRPDPNDLRDPSAAPPLRRGGPVAGPDPTTPATSPNVQQAATDAIRGIRGPGGGKGDRHIRDPNAPVSPEDDVGDLAALKKQHDAERAAAEQQLAAGKAQSLQTAAAKSGAAGFGLSGASAALQGDVGRAADRNAVLTMADLRGKQNDENFAELQREVALNAAEEDADTDLNHDGFIAGHKVGSKIGDGDPDNNPASKDQTATELGASARAIVAGAGGTGKPNDPYGGIGGMGEDKLRQLADAGLTFSDPRVEHGLVNGEVYIYVRGSDGAYYKFLVPKDAATSDGAATGWFETTAGM